MYPDKHLRDVKRSKRLKKAFSSIAPAFSFIAGFFLLAPLIHELSHIAYLEFLSCNYNAVFDYSLTGFRASIAPLCSLEWFESSIFYLSGYFSSAVIGLSFSLKELESDFHNKLSKIFGSGFLLSIIVTGTYEGDLYSLAEIYSLKTGTTHIFIVLMSIAISAVVLLTLVRAWNQNGNIESSIKP